MNVSLSRFVNASWPLLLVLLLFTADASAAIDSVDLMDDIVQKFKDNASSWATKIEAAATRLFWILVVISMVWTFGMMALRKADIGEFFAEFTRFTIFTGFFWWLLYNGPAFAMSIIDSLMRLGGAAASMTGLTGSFSPSSIVDIGFILLGKAFYEISPLSPIDSFIGVILALFILALSALIAVNMLLLLISAWILAYGGIFFLGFGGSRWTSDMAINYYKTVLGIAAQIMTMILLIGIGKSLIFDYYNNMESGIDFSEMAVVMIVVLVIFVLTNKVPQLISGIITGASVGGMGIGQFGAGAAMGAAGMAAAAAAVGGAMVAAGATQGAGGASALMAAFSQANANVASGSDVLTSLWGGGSGGGGGSDPSGGGSGGGGLPGTGNTPLAEAAGFSSPMGSTAPAGGDNGGTAASGGSGSGDTAANSGGGQYSVAGEGGGASSSDGGGSNGDDSGPGTQQTASDSGGSSPQQPKGGFMAAAAMAASTATKIAADAGANLAKGSGSIVKDKAANIVDSAKGAINQTAGGKIASEIRNPGSTTQARQDKQDIAAAGELREQLQADEARDFLAEHSGAGSDNTPSFGDNSLSGEDADPQSEVAAFVNRDNGTQNT
ncbi:P-type conjugative transfer protein TrbL [Shewanella indica]|uniref:P-type conjugative transfer protein TrbL n=1 Tax=Shewanella indica TaxID=768528 RepID=A0ABU4QI84_9GAMM|nr:P-type conjugative transfer protein TrbL [Shewanella indica]MDX6018633.1 P-type conjugative transfer protein TrbL [Shewanella indica]